MVVSRIKDRDPNWEAKAEAERKLARTEEERKEALIEEMKKERADIICLALMYAKNFEETGGDITRCTINAIQNIQYLEAAYKKGVDDTIARVRRGEIKV